MSTSAGMRSLAITFPGGLKTNDYWRRHHPQMFGGPVEKRNVWAAPEGPRDEPDAFGAEMAKFLDDPFRGNGGSIGLDVIPQPRFLWRTEMRGFGNAAAVFPNAGGSSATRHSMYVVTSLGLVF